MKARGQWQGVLSIFRFNWPLFAVAGFVVVAAILALAIVPFWWGRMTAVLALLGGLHFLLVSLGVSHFVYDRSDLYRFSWLKRALAGGACGELVLCHSGFDEVSSELRSKLSGGRLVILDHYDPTTMTEASIRRARCLFPPGAETVCAAYRAWPLASESVDVVFGMLAIHELRSESERTEWFSEARRCLRPGGRIILVEHVRDFANFLAFGPGFLHFHSVASWGRCWTTAGLGAIDSFRVTPWVRVFVLSR